MQIIVPLAFLQIFPQNVLFGKIFCSTIHSSTPLTQILSTYKHLFLCIYPYSSYSSFSVIFLPLEFRLNLGEFLLFFYITLQNY